MSPLLPLRKKAKTEEKRRDGKNEAEAKALPQAPSGGGIAHEILVSAHVTEKAGRLEGMNQYVFRVSRKAKKSQVAQAVSELYGVRPMRVNMISLPGKTRRRGAFVGSKSGRRKAIVTLPAGKTIEVLPK